MHLNIDPYVRYIAKTTYFIDNKFIVANDCRILYIISGNGNFECEDKNYALNPGTLIYYPYGLPYCITSNNSLLFYTVNFDFDCFNMHVNTMIPQSADKCDFDKIIPSIKGNLQNIFNSVIRFENAIWAEKYIRNIYCETLEKKYGYIESQSSFLRILLIDICRKRNSCNSSSELCEKIKSLVSAKCHLNNKSLSQACGYHPFYLNDVFKKKEGVTLHKYILHQRLIKSYELVNTTTKSLEEIAVICGFSSQSHLSTAFKKEYGISPGKLRSS